MKRLIAVLGVLALTFQFIPGPIAWAHGDDDDDDHGGRGRRITVSGYKFNDANGNGMRDADESSLSGWTIYAHKGPDKANEVLGSTVTNANGYYEIKFTNRSYTKPFYVQEQMKEGWRQTLPGAGADFQYELGPNQGNRLKNINFGNTTLVESCDARELVTNGGFEKPVVKSSSRWTAFPDGTTDLVWDVLRAGGGASSKGLELQRGYAGWLSDEGQQFAELDSYHPVKISQEIDTLPGEVYKLSFAFSPRPGTSANDNALNVTWGGQPVATVAAQTAVATQTQWTTYTYWLLATTEKTVLTFVDAGATANSLGTFIDDVSVKCSDVDGRILGGSKFEDLDGDGTWDETEPTIENWPMYATKALESFAVNAAGPAVVSPVFEDGKNYVVQVVGTYDAGDGVTADAMYSVKEPNTLWTDGTSPLLDLQIDGVSPYWGEYTLAHTYFTPIVGTGAAKMFVINDIIPTDNFGSLMITIFEVLDATVTSSSGAYELNVADWQGVESVVILENTWQPGWIKTFPGVLQGFGYSVTWEEAWSQNLIYNFGNQRVILEEEPPEEPPSTGTLSVSVVVINDNGGSKTEADFTVNVTAISGIQTVSASALGVDVVVEDAYITALVGDTEAYTVTYGAECDTIMPTGGAKSCVITVDDMDVFAIDAPVAPTVGCVDNLGNGKLAAHFGYINLNAGPVLISAGTNDNRITGGGLVDTDQGQPSLFDVGFVVDAFEVIFDADKPVVWTINTPVGEFSIEANNLTERCGGDTPDYPTLTLKKVFENNIAGHLETDFVFMIDGAPVPLDTPIVVSSNSNHNITEAYVTGVSGNLSDDYITTFSADCPSGNVELTLGQDVVCTITNTGITP